MAYGMKLLDSVGGTIYDSSSQGGVFVEFLTLPNITSSTIYNVTYPQLPNSNIYVIPLQSGDHAYKLYGPTDTVPGYAGPLGYPVIQYKKTSTPGMYGFFLETTILMVFAL